MLWPGIKKLGKKLRLKRTGSEVVGVIKNCFVRMYDGNNKKVLELFAPEIDSADKEEISKKIKAGKIKNHDWLVNGVRITFTEIIRPYSMQKIENLLHELVDYFESKYPDRKPQCQKCGLPKEADVYYMNNASLFICDDCFNQMESDVNDENMERQYIPNNYLSGFMGALLFSIPGVLLTVLFFVFLDKLAAVSALVCVFLGIKGYKKFKGKMSPFGAFLIIAAALIMVALGVTVSYAVAIFRKIGVIDIDALKYVFGIPEVQRELILNIVLSYIVSGFYLVFQLVQMIREWKTWKLIQKAREI